MPIETIRYVVSGANPGTGTIRVNFDNNGNGTGSISLAGVSAGVDTVQAFIDSFSLSSNAAQVVWQGANGPISIGPILAYLRAGSGNLQAFGPTGWNAPLTLNSLMFNSHPQSILPGDPHQSGDQANPMVNNAITSTGYYAGDISMNDGGGGLDIAMVGSFVVAAAGNVTFTTYVNSASKIGCPGATFVSGAQNFGGVNGPTPIMGYAALAGRNGSWPGGNYAVDTYTLNFPSPGVYPFEIYFSSGTASEREYALLANGNVIPPASLVTVPPAPSAGTGQLILSPNSAGPDILGTTQTFSVTASGLVFRTSPYIPILEGTSCSFLLTNNPGGSFTFPTLPNGGTVDPVAALAVILGLSGDNTSWQNRISLSWNGTCYVLSYNGSAIDPNVAVTNLTVTNNDIAWYDPSNQAVDVFGVTNQGGGSIAQVPLYWLVNPSIASVSPTTLTGDGGTYTISFNLAKPLPPIQGNVQATFTGGAGYTVVSSVANLNSAGWVTGWTLTVTTDVIYSDQASTISLALSDTTLSWMNGAALTSGTLTSGTLNYPLVNPLVTNITISGIPMTQQSGFVSAGGTGCPAVEMYVHRGQQANRTRIADMLDCLSEDFASVEAHPVEAYTESLQSCYRLFTENGAEVIVSTSTPVPTVEALADIAGGATEVNQIAAFAYQIKPGMHLFTLIDDELVTSKVTIAEPVGFRRVAKVSVGGRNFACGAVASRRIFTHNIQLVSK